MCLGFNHRIKNQTQVNVMLKTDDQDDDDMLGYGLLSWPLLRPPVCVVMMINSSLARIT